MKMKLGTVGVLSVGWLFVTAPVAAAAAAQASPASQDCRSILDDAARLACYDGQDAAAGIDGEPAMRVSEETAPVADRAPPAPADPVPAPADPAPAPAVAPASTAGSASARELTDEVGRENLSVPGDAEEGLSVRGKVTSCRKDLTGKYVFYFDNGQVWRQKDNLRLRWRDCAFDVMISEDFFGYKMQPDGEQKTVRIAREK